MSMRRDLLDEERLPSERVRIAARTDSGSDSISSRLATSSRLASSLSGWRRIYRSRPRPGPCAARRQAPAGCVCLGTAGEELQDGQSRQERKKADMTSTDAGSAQWMSSHTTTTGPRSAKARTTRASEAT